MLSNSPKLRQPIAPENPEELIKFLDTLLWHENASSKTTQQEELTKEFQSMYEQEFLTEMDEDKFQLIYGTASILRDQLYSSLLSHVEQCLQTADYSISGLSTYSIQL
jgi:hypothetical protein